MTNKAVLAINAVAAFLLIFIIPRIGARIQLESDEVGLKYDNYRKRLKPEPFYAGLHSGPIGFSFIIFPSVFKTISHSSIKCRNREGVEITLSVSYQYRVKPQLLYEIVLQFRDYEAFKVMLKYVGESAIRDSCSQFNISQFQTERGAFQEHLTQRLVVKYDPIHTDVKDLQLKNIGRPGQYDSALKQKESAREDIQVARNERPQALTEAGTKLREAETHAEIIINEANSKSRILKTAAQSEAVAIFNQYAAAAATYKRLVSDDGLNLDSEGLLAYVGMRGIETPKKSVIIGLEAQAKASHVP